MTTEDIDDYLVVEFNVADPKELNYTDRIIAYERLKHQLPALPADEYTKAIIRIAEHLDI